MSYYHLEPGGREAVKRGCTCPVIDNHHGRGFQGKRGCHIITAGCPVHDPKEGCGNG